jgi:uncharacterized protein YndB with AHSA1/START domain
MEQSANKKEGLKIVREFKAPIILVFEAFATAEAFASWWGPAGMPVTVSHFDFRNGGKTHYKMEGHGQIMWGLFRYQTIVKPDSISFISSFSDENGNVCKAPFPIEFPLEIFNEMQLEEKDGTTTLTLSGYPLNATAEQEATYYSMKENMSQGFAGTFNQLDDYLEKMQG